MIITVVLLRKWTVFVQNAEEQPVVENVFVVVVTHPLCANTVVQNLATVLVKVCVKTMLKFQIYFSMSGIYCIFLLSKIWRVREIFVLLWRKDLSIKRPLGATTAFTSSTQQTFFFRFLNIENRVRHPPQGAKSLRCIFFRTFVQ